MDSAVDEESQKIKSSKTPRSPSTKSSVLSNPHDTLCGLCQRELHSSQHRIKCKTCLTRFHKDCHEKSRASDGDRSCPICPQGDSRSLLMCEGCNQQFAEDALKKTEHKGRQIYICHDCFQQAKEDMQREDEMRKTMASGGYGKTFLPHAQNVTLSTNVAPNLQSQSGENVKPLSTDGVDVPQPRDGTPPSNDEITETHPTTNVYSATEQPQQNSNKNDEVVAGTSHTSPHKEQNNVSNGKSKSVSMTSSNRSKKAFLQKKIEEMEKDQKALAQTLLENSKQIDELKQLGNQIGSVSASSVNDTESVVDSVERTLNWILTSPKSKVSFKNLDQSSVAQKSDRTILKPSSSSRQGGSRDQFHRSSTPIPWLNARNQNDFLNSINVSRGGTREEALEKSTTKLTSVEVAARHVIKQKLPQFSGNPEDWPNFIHVYITTTKRCAFTDDENAARLRDSLKGEALKLVEKKLTFPEKVPQVLALLRLKFGRPEQIIDSITDRLEKEVPIKPEDLNGLVNFAAVVDDLCSTLKAARMDSELVNPKLMRTIVQKLPSTYRVQWGLYRRANPGLDCDNISTFYIWLYDLAEIAAEMSDTCKKPAQIVDKSKGTATKSFRSIHATSIATNESSESTSHSPKCPVCKNASHIIHECYTFLRQTGTERWQTVRDKSLCGKCLKEHNYRNCKKSMVCGVSKCDKKHHPLLHYGYKAISTTEKSQNASTNKEKPEKEKEAETKNPNAEVCHHSAANKSFFRIIPVHLYDADGNSFTTHAMLDEGSSVTLIDEDVANQLQLEGTKTGLCLKWTNNVTREEADSRKVEVKISSDRGGKQFMMSGVHTVRNMNLPVQSLTSAECDIFGNLPITQYRDAAPKLLIGLPHWPLALPLDYCEDFDHNVTAIKSRLGWTIVGHIGTEGVSANVNVHQCQCPEEVSTLIKQVKDFFSLEYFGVRCLKPIESSAETRAVKILNDTITFTNGHYQVGLLWKRDDVTLPDSKFMAMQRLRCLERKLNKDHELNIFVQQQIIDYLSKGYIEELSSEEANTISKKTWYLPVFTVTNPNKPGKIRLVWDAAAKVKGTSLNSELLTGPDLLCSLVDILRKFRERRYAVIADIKEMFHQVGIIKEDRDSQRFLWRNHPDAPIRTFRMNVMTFGAACSPYAAQFVKNHHANQYAEKFPRAVEAITSRHYVDDYADSFSTIQEAVQVTKEVIQIQKEGGFELRSFVSNDQHILRELGETQTSATKTLDYDDNNNITKVLGVFWRTSDDTLNVHSKMDRIDQDLLFCRRKATKRDILRTMMMIFDPLGLITPFLVQIKIILQRVWQLKCDWDEAAPDHIQQQWEEWLRSLQKLDVSIPRWHGFTDDNVDLHLFVDASENAFAAVGYFRFGTPEGGYRCSLVGAKSKVAPQKPLSIPRLELQAAVLGVRLARSIEDSHEVKIINKVFWSDSTNVLGWINSEARKFKIFVSLRIGEILESTQSENWRYVPSALNVADDATKPKGGDVLLSSSRWYNGPEFLREDEHAWPPQKNLKVDMTEEVRTVSLQVRPTVRHATPDPTRISKWENLVRAQVWVYRTLNHAKNKVKYPYHQFSLDELEEAEREIWREVQNKHYSEELHLLRNGLPIKPTSKLYSLTPFIDEDQIIRMKGRLRFSEAPRDAKQPIILPRDDRAVHLLIDSFHRKFLHQSNETVVNELRQKYWISKVRATVSSVINRCRSCRNKKARPIVPLMADLPPARVNPCSAFSHVGLDYFGPIDIIIGRKIYKRWGVVFTCLTVRAVSLDVVSNLTSDSTIMCLQRFVAKRGVPICLYSDNATCFKGASKELQTINFEEVADQLDGKVDKFDWKFIPPAAPHMGGCWERLVRSVKAVLTRISPIRTPTEEQFRTFLAQAENMINSRPLTYMPQEVGAPEAITPNHFILLNSNGSKTFGTIPNDGKALQQMWRMTQLQLDGLWKRWTVEYVSLLNKRQKWHDVIKPIQIGDIGTIWDDNVCNSYKLGRIVDVTTASDGQVRAVTVKTAKGTYCRPASKFAKFEFEDDEATSQSGEQSVDLFTKGGNVAEENNKTK